MKMILKIGWFYDLQQVERPEVRQRRTRLQISYNVIKRASKQP